jgi:hypothetical protein
MDQGVKQAHLQTAQAKAQAKVSKRACYAHPENKKISPLTEKIKLCQIIALQT